MKKIFVLAMISLIAISSVSAQYRPKKMPRSKHRTSSSSSSSSSSTSEISLGVGYMTTGNLINFIESMKQAQDNVNSHSDNMNTKMAVFGPAITAQYLYSLSEHVSIGAGVVYQQATGVQSILSDMAGGMPDPTGEAPAPYVFKGNYITLIPTAKFYWFNREHFAMYTRLAIGGTYRMESINGESDNSFMVNGQLSPVCVEFGGEHFRVFLEEGIGANGSGFGGLKYSF